MPSMVQIAGVPLSFCQRMSDLAVAVKVIRGMFGERVDSDGDSNRVGVGGGRVAGRDREGVGAVEVGAAGIGEARQRRVDLRLPCRRWLRGRCRCR